MPMEQGSSDPKMPADQRAAARTSQEEHWHEDRGIGVRGWIAANESFLRVLFSIAAYASAILLLVSLFLVGPANLRTKILAAVLVVAVAALCAIRRASKSQRERQRAADSSGRRP